VIVQNAEIVHSTLRSYVEHDNWLISLQL